MLQAKLLLLALAVFAVPFTAASESRTPTAREPIAVTDAAPFIQAPTEDLTIPGGDKFTILQLVLELERLTGERIIFSRDAEQSMKVAPVRLREDLHIPAREVSSVVQSILIANRFVITDARRAEPRMLQVASLESTSRASIRQQSYHVPLEQIEAYAENHALLITTTVHFEHLDVHTTGNSLRQWIVDPNTTQIIPFATANSVVITGLAPWVRDTVEMLRRLDEGAKLTQERARAKRAAEPENAGEDD